MEIGSPVETLHMPGTIRFAELKAIRKLLEDQN